MFIIAIWKTLKKNFFHLETKKMDFFRFFQKVFLKKKHFWSWPTSKFFYQKLAFLHISPGPKIWVRAKSLSCFFSRFCPQGVHFDPFFRPRALGNRQIRPECGRDDKKNFPAKNLRYCRLLHKKNRRNSSKIHWDRAKYFCSVFFPPHGRN